MTTIASQTTTLKIRRDPDAVLHRYYVDVDDITVGWVSKSSIDGKWSAHAKTTDELGRGELIIRNVSRRRDVIFELLLAVRRTGYVYVLDADAPGLTRPVEIAAQADRALDLQINHG